VKVRGMSLAVFGTSFNVNSYEPGKGIGTTLVEGKVTMRIDNGKEYVMRPHEHITYNLETDTYSVLKNVDVSLYTSWKDGVFRFENQRLEDITNRLSRWYSCEVVYNDNSLRDLKFTGVAKKNEPIDHLLNLISLLKDVDYDVKDGVVFISKRRN
jgi:ferric-dicitrate binding protein FerR (iron transport regulator)